LRPKEAVRLWLKQMQPLDVGSFLERLTNCPASEDPKVRIPEMAAKAVRKSLNEKMMTPAEAMNAEFQARKQAGFLLMLVINLHLLVLGEYFVSQWLEMIERWHRLQLQLQEEWTPLLLKKLAGIIESAAELNKMCAGNHSVLDELARLSLLRETAAAISKRYFDDQPVLVAGAETRLTARIQELQSLVLADKECQTQSSVAVELAALESSIKERVPQAVEALVVNTEALVLERLGQWEAAWKLRQQHATRVVESRISMCHHAGD
jgi:hypothetical protein